MSGLADPNADRLARVALACLVEPGNRELGVLVRRVGAVQALAMTLREGAVSDALYGRVKVRLDARRAATTAIAAVQDVAAEVLERTERLGANLVTPSDDEWPRQVDHLARISREDGERLERDTDPPLCIWTRGAASLGEALDRSVAIVGARAATSYGEHVASEFAYALAQRDWTVVSGGAFGIDAAGHRAALAAGGLTAVVLACGIDQVYPLAHASLFDRIADEGLLLSEWPPGAAPHRMRFLTRNRVIAAVTQGTLVVEAGARSGSRNTLRRARQLGRSAMVVPGPITSAASVGCHAELRQPGNRLVSTLDEIVEEIGRVGELADLRRGPHQSHDALDPLAARVLDAIRPRKARTAEEIAAIVGVSAREARQALPALEMSGLVVLSDGGYRLAPPPKKTAGASP
jgi:DNA processing protein